MKEKEGATIVFAHFWPTVLTSVQTEVVSTLQILALRIATKTLPSACDSLQELTNYALFDDTVVDTYGHRFS